MTSKLAAEALRTVGQGDAVPNDFVAPYYLGDLKRRISVARVDDRLYAFDDLCTCADEPCPLSSGRLTGTTLMCQCHGSQFEVTTGAVINGPATKPLNVYEVREVEGLIQIRTEAKHHVEKELTNDGQADSAVQEEQRTQTQTRLALAAMLIALLFVIRFAARRIGTSS